MKRLPKPARILVGLALLGVAGLLVSAHISPRKGYAPHQPVYFQHSKMAAPPNWVTDADGKEVNMGGYGIPCLYCHNMPYKGRHSTLPSTDICMNCHTTVGQDKEWVLVLKQYHERGEPIPWVKVHDLPDFVYYDHSVHLTAVDKDGKLKLQPLKEGGNACEHCHGDVETTDIVSTVNRFNMGWCLDCHRKTEMAAPVDCIACHR